MMGRLCLFLALLVTGAAFAEPPVDVPRKTAAKAKPAAKAKAPARPAWAELTAEQQKILAPLKADWDSLEPERRRKWIGVAKRYPQMNFQAQERVQRRMQAWAKLTPEQRRLARENYKRLAKQPPAKREQLRQQWAEYQRERYPEIRVTPASPVVPAEQAAQPSAPPPAAAAGPAAAPEPAAAADQPISPPSPQQ
jgi:hypothetical protein